ncbi:hypothetical protein HPB50_024782 [Hyalomma asiaticum]|uniref:Uncharacterized protein n=1 Tax=Hyalomma asiaticum TaxID=266040 RepID=A0ACB7T9B9_HYAAI|nr:hypothetical protein HPB50_024782 [Hyalomma asiaticum]
MLPSGLQQLPSARASAFLVVLVGALLWTYWKDIHLYTRRVRRNMRNELLFRDDNCDALSAQEICEREELVKVLFVVDTELDNLERRNFARQTYARRRFASRIHWLTLFRMMGQNKSELPDQLTRECRTSRDIVVPEPAYATAALQPGGRKMPPTFLAFVPWIQENCPDVDLVVHMHDAVLPHPFYLPNYRVLHMDHQPQVPLQSFEEFVGRGKTSFIRRHHNAPQVIHCHGTGLSTAECRSSSVLMTKRKGIEALAKNGSEQEGLLVTGNLEVRDISSYIAVNETMTMLYTIGAVIFYTYPPNLNVSMLSLWDEMMAAPENSPHYLRL